MKFNGSSVFLAGVMLLAILFGSTTMVQAQLTAEEEEKLGDTTVVPVNTMVVSSIHLFHSKPYSIVSYILLIMYPFVKG